MFVENRTLLSILTTSLEIEVCTVLKALGEVASLYSSASSLSQKSRQYFITKLFIPCLFIYFLICTGDGGGLGLTGLVLTWIPFFVSYENFLMFCLL